MKLRNRKTGETIEVNRLRTARMVNGVPEMLEYSSLAELNKEWEDVPEEYYCIDCNGEITVYDNEETDFDKECKAFGNYFNTLEEAEKAVKKLKAWKRLKDKGFRFKKWESYEETSGLSFSDRHIVNSYTAIFDFNKPCRKHEIENEVKADLDLLFGGVE